MDVIDAYGDRLLICETISMMWLIASRPIYNCERASASIVSSNTACLVSWALLPAIAFGTLRSSTVGVSVARRFSGWSAGPLTRR